MVTYTYAVQCAPPLSGKGALKTNWKSWQQTWCGKMTLSGMEGLYYFCHLRQRQNCNEDDQVVSASDHCYFSRHDFFSIVLNVACITCDCDENAFIFGKQWNINTLILLWKQRMHVYSPADEQRALKMYSTNCEGGLQVRQGQINPDSSLSIRFIYETCKYVLKNKCYEFFFCQN